MTLDPNGKKTNAFCGEERLLLLFRLLADVWLAGVGVFACVTRRLRCESRMFGKIAPRGSAW